MKILICLDIFMDMPAKKHRITSKEVEEKLDEEIEKVLKEKIDSGLDEKIEEQIEEKLSQKTGQIIDEHLDQEESTVSSEEESAPKLNPLTKIVKEFRTDFHFCWQGSCRTVSLLTLPLYLAIIILLLFCHLSGRCSAKEGFIPIIVLFSVVGLAIISLLFSFFSKYPRTALLFWLILDIPLLIIILIFSAKFIAPIILAVVMIIRIIQISRGEY